MTVLVTVKLVHDGEKIGEKTFEANFATTDPVLRFENAIAWMIANTNPIGDELQLAAMEQIVANRRAALAEAKAAKEASDASSTD